MKIPQMIVSTEKLAQHFKLSPRRIQQLVKLGLPKIARGKFDYVEAAKFYIRFLQNALENKGAVIGDGSLELFRSQKARALTVTAQLKELELKKAARRIRDGRGSARGVGRFRSDCASEIFDGADSTRGALRQPTIAHDAASDS